jgi:BirA family biotin operon repressor/biotin-[acetyl-CoA-carboxylase] ligase
MKSRILDILRSKDHVVSGEHLSSLLGISRVAVWKHMQKLKECGYDIDTSANGYRLVFSPDVLFPWEFPERESRIHFFPCVTSTMDIARDMARKGCPDFSVVVAGRQTKGRGRLKRVWHSEEGGLYFTVVLRPDLPLAWAYRVNFCASYSLARVLRRLFSIPACVKWPNDLLVNDKKISGMLSEMEAEGDLLEFITIGLGMNVNNDAEHMEPGAVSLKSLLGKPVFRKTILNAFLDELEMRLADGDLENAITEWKTVSITLNRSVKIVTHGGEFRGRVLDVDESGALVLETEGGNVKKVIYGDCFHLPRTDQEWMK